MSMLLLIGREKQARTFKSLADRDIHQLCQVAHTIGPVRSEQYASSQQTRQTTALYSSKN
jgi:flagellar motor switch protein FliG